MQRLLQTRRNECPSAPYQSEESLERYTQRRKEDPSLPRPISFAVGGIDIEGGDPNATKTYKQLTSNLLAQASQDPFGINHSAPSQGTLEVRKLICEEKSIEAGVPLTAENIVITDGGGKGALSTVFTALLHRDRNAPAAKVAVIRPAWCSYGSLIETSGAKPVFYDAPASAGYKITPEELRTFLKQSVPLEEQVSRFAKDMARQLKTPALKAEGCNAINAALSTTIRPADFSDQEALAATLRAAIHTAYPAEAEAESFEHFLATVKQSLDATHPLSSYKTACDVYLHQRLSNPKGIAYTRSELEEFVAICKELGVVIVEDNAYSAHIPDPKIYPSILSITTEEVISINEVSKDNTLRGLRIGIVTAPEEVATAVAAHIRDTHSFVATPSQIILAKALQSKRAGNQTNEHTIIPRQKLEHAAAIFQGSLLEPEIPPLGYFLTLSFDQNLFQNGKKAVEYLIDKGIAAVEGEAFDGDNSTRPWIRLALGTVTAEELEEGCKRIKAAFAERKAAKETGVVLSITTPATTCHTATVVSPSGIARAISEASEASNSIGYRAQK